MDRKILLAAECLTEALRRKGWTMGCAESCTGGLIGGAMTALPGSSEVFLGGIIAYANEVKMHLLGVPPEVLARYGAVSKECAEAMVRGCAGALKVSCACSVTGIAGPGGGSEEKPVGTVYIGILIPGAVSVTNHHFSGNRRQIRLRTVETALSLLCSTLSD